MTQAMSTEIVESVVECGSLRIVFTRDYGCLPEQVILIDRDGRETVLLDRGYRLEAELADGRVIHPVVPGDEAGPAIYRRQDVQYVEYAKIPWADERGNIVPDFYFSIRHEFMPDGTAFASALFNVEQFHPIPVRRFELTAYLKLEAWKELAWGISYPLKENDGPLIQAVFPERFLKRGEKKILSRGIFPSAGFCAGNFREPAFYGEFFVEGNNTVSGNSAENDSSVTWENGNAVLRWNFQNQSTGERTLPLQWRNCWGWILQNPPVKRHFPPMRMYHFFDNARHYPDAEQMAAIADAGCDLLVFHENWRFDVQNDGMPYDAGRFRRLISQAHENNIRVAVYIRGNERSVVEDSCAWFDQWLRRNFDGLYMDYGSPFCASAAPDEMYQNGRILFREHYHRMQRLRRTVGKDGLFFSHTGPLFSAVGMNFMDGYVSGEGEQGILVKGRPEHEYFSMAYVNHGTMWTAAFPEYSSEKMVPFLAAAGQYPHNPLGSQMPTCSLAHPPEPGLNDLAFRPLWKLWSCFRNEKNLSVFNDYNCREVFQTDFPDAGFYLMVSEDQRRGLLLVSNFSQQSADLDFAFDRRRTGLTADRCSLLTFDDSQIPMVQTQTADGKYRLRLPANGVAGLLLTSEETEAKEMLREFQRPYHKIGELGRAWCREVEEQRRLRTEPPEWGEVWLKLRLPVNVALPYEDSLILDLYNEKVQLGEFDDEGIFHPAGWIGMKHFTGEETAESEQLQLGEFSAAVPLHRIFGPGRHAVGVCSYHLGMPFYSFLEAWLSSEKEEKYCLIFRNELEKHRAFLTWNINVRAEEKQAESVQ